MALIPLDRYPTEPNKPLPPTRELWYTALVRLVNGLLTSTVDLAVLIAANTASIVANTAAIAAQAITIAANTAAIALLQPTLGTWTPIDASGAALSFTTPLFSSSNFYVKTGRMVLVNFSLQYPATGSGATAMVGGLPFTSDNAFFSGAILSSGGIGPRVQVNAGGTTFNVMSPTDTSLTNTALTAAVLYGSFSYKAST